MHAHALDILKEKSATPQTRLDALWQLLSDGFSRPTADTLTAILQDADDHPDVRSGAALTLGTLGRDSALGEEFGRLLGEALGDPHPTVRHYAARALGALGRVETAPALIRALGDADHLVFHTAAEALGRFGAQAGPALLALLESDAADDARCIAAWKLGEISYEPAITALASAVQRETNLEVVALCAWALGEIGVNDPAAMVALQAARERPERAIADRARRALRKIARHYN
ncbi:MAG: HEAT repeat domain-containing protein [Vampirovibrionales bacterium]|nr:HEAT repeat domain-containing protein [Vampirovibrionales bacterium]